MSFTAAGDRDHGARQALKDIIGGGGNYFYVELPEGTLLAHPLSPGEKLPMQFGREVRNQHSIFFFNFLLVFFLPFLVVMHTSLCQYWEYKQSKIAFCGSAQLTFDVNVHTSDLQPPHQWPCCQVWTGLCIFYKIIVLCALVITPLFFSSFQVLANILGTPERGDWKECKLEVSEERALADQFKEQFQKFDPMTWHWF